MSNIYRSLFNPNYLVPDLIKYWCLDCDKEFILSNGYDNSNIKCPYCQSKSVESIVILEDEDLLADLGCMAIGFLKEND